MSANKDTLVDKCTAPFWSDGPCGLPREHPYHRDDHTFTTEPQPTDEPDEAPVTLADSTQATLDESDLRARQESFTQWWTNERIGKTRGSDLLSGFVEAKLIVEAQQREIERLNVLVTKGRTLNDLETALEENERLQEKLRTFRCGIGCRNV